MTDSNSSRNDRSSPGDAARAVTPDRTAAVAPSTAPTPAGAGRTATAPQYGERTDRAATLQREKAEFGGMRFFLAFFGWLTATGAIVLMSAIVAAILAALGVQDSASRTAGNTGELQTAGELGFVVLAVLLFVGGYVAGRMARFSGLKQGLAVWLWAVIIAVLVAAAGAIASTSVGAFSQLNTAGLPISGSLATSAGIIALVVAIVFSLAGALLGGLGGMRFHRRVDRFAGNA